MADNNAGVEQTLMWLSARLMRAQDLIVAIDELDPSNKTAISCLKQRAKNYLQSETEALFTLPSIEVNKNGCS